MKLLKCLAVCALLCGAFLFVLHQLYDAGYRRHYVHEIALMDERLNGRQPFDLLFLGSSRVAHQLNPKIADSMLGLHSFNAGLDGIKLTEMNTVLEAYLQTHKAPALVVMDLPPGSFNGDVFPFFNQTLYYPFLDNEVVFRNLEDHRPVHLFRLLPFLQLTEANDEMRQRAVSGLFGKRYSEPGDNYKGYGFPPADTLGLAFRRQPGVNAPITQKGIGYLKRTLELCRSRNVPLLIIFPPNYKSLDLELNPAFYPTARQVANVPGVQIADYRNLPIKDDHRLFRDQTHLNKAGADSFTRIVCRDVMSFLAQQATAPKSRRQQDF